jgi:hypothetical protein
MIAAGAGTLLLAANAWAQVPTQERGRSTTQSLNTAPPRSTLPRDPNAPPPWAVRTPPAQPSQPRTLDEALAKTQTQTTMTEAESGAEPATGVILAEGETEPDPIPITLGYYVRGDKDCDQVWPGDGDLAWMTPTSFTIDYGGCEPGQFLQTGPNSWSEEQRCLTESGGNAGAYTVSYEMIGTDVISRSARLALDGSVEQDDWKHCRLEDVPENARFGS